MKYDAPVICARALFLPRAFFTVALVASILSTIPAHAQAANYSPDSLFVALLPGGDALVEYDIKVANPQQDATVTLFGIQDFRDLIVADFNDKLVAYDAGPGKNQIILRTPNVTDVRISYSTQDLLNKTGKVWTFSLNSPVGFTVKLPAEGVLTDTTGAHSPSINTVGGQYLLTFEPGLSGLSYVIGVVGTQSQAAIVIKAAETTIKEVQSQYPDIILTSANDLLKNATAALAAGKFSDAERLAGNANDLAVSTGRDYADAQAAIASAEVQISNATAQGHDVASAATILQTAKDQFAKGSYSAAKNTADQSVLSIGSVSGGGAGTGGGADNNVLIIVVAVAAIAGAGGGGAMFYIRTRHHLPRPGPTQVARTERETPAPEGRDNDPPQRQPPAPLEEPAPRLSPEAQQWNDAAVEKPEEIAEPRPMGGAMPTDPQISTSVLSRIVSRIFEEKPGLRPEDRDVLNFLAEKEGAAFESEIRGKFLLPKTTIWRLVKRLEREDLVEIRKAGGQNLIKLRFEGRES